MKSPVAEPRAVLCNNGRQSRGLGVDTEKMCAGDSIQNLAAPTGGNKPLAIPSIQTGLGSTWAAGACQVLSVFPLFGFPDSDRGRRTVRLKRVLVLGSSTVLVDRLWEAVVMLMAQLLSVAVSVLREVPLSSRLGCRLCPERGPSG